MRVLCSPQYISKITSKPG